MRHGKSLFERWILKVDVRASGCWEWLGSKTADGYAHIGGGREYGGRVVKAVIVAWEFAHGKRMPKGYEPDHLCRNRGCVRPSHVEAVTKKVNILRGVGPTAQNAKKTHCKRGHPLSGKNLFRHKDGRRECRECHRVSQLLAYHRLHGKGKWKWSKKGKSQ